MSAKFEFTDNQWYNFICGFQAGMRLKDLGEKPYEKGFTLKPINVGGGGIGLAMPSLDYDSSLTEYEIPVFTHDVDIAYSGFSVNIKIDSRARFKRVEEGDFGTIGGVSSSADIKYQYNNGILKAYGLKDKNTEYNEPIILFYIIVSVAEEPLKGVPIKLEFDNLSNSDINYTTLMTYKEVESEKYVFFITPLDNKNGYIGGEREEEKVISDVDVYADSTPSGVYIGCAFTAPENRGCVNIVSNSNKEDNFPYNKVHLKMMLEDDYLIYTYLNVIGINGFEITEKNIEYIDINHTTIEIYAERKQSLIDSITFCYLDYYIGSSELTRNYVIPIKNLESELINTEE